MAGVAMIRSLRSLRAKTFNSSPGLKTVTTPRAEATYILPTRIYMIYGYKLLHVVISPTLFEKGKP
jgi:hypothetical protein